MADTLGGGERLKFPTIEENSNRSRCDAGHDDVNYIMGKVEMNKDFTNKAPLELVKSFLDVNLKHQSSLSFFPWCEGFLRQ